MSKAFGFVLLGGLLLIVLLSLALLTWVWIRSSNEPNTTSVTPKAGQVLWVENSTVALVDSRLAGTGSLASHSQDYSFAVNSPATAENATTLAAIADELAVACA